MRLICVRHGKPDVTYPRRFWVSARELNEAMDAYDAAGLDASFHRHPGEFPGCFVISSPLPRALETAGFLTRRPLESIPVDPVFREVPLPRFRNPSLKLPPMALLALSRLGWWIGFMRGEESFSDTRLRVKHAADKLEELCDTHGEVALFSHGFFLWLLMREFSRRRWTVEGSGPFRYLEKRIVRKK